MSEEKASRARERELHELRLDLKHKIEASLPGTARRHTYVRQLEALDVDADAAHEKWFADLKEEYPLRDC